MQLTRGKWSDHSPAFGLDGALYFLSNRPAREGADAGHERRQQVFRLDPRGGDPTCVTDEPLGVGKFAVGRGGLVVLAARHPGVALDKQRAHAAELAEHGPTSLRYSAMPVRYWDHWLPETANHIILYHDGASPEDLTPDAAPLDYSSASLTLNADASKLATVRVEMTHADRIPSSVVEVFDLLTGASTRYAHPEPRGDYEGPIFSPDSSRLALVATVRQDGACGARQLGLLNLDDASLRLLAEDVDLWLHPECFTSDGAEIIATADDRAAAPIFAVSVADGALRRVSEAGPVGHHSALKPLVGEPARVVGLHSSLLDAPGVFVCSLDTGSRSERLELEAARCPVDRASVSVESIEAPTTDGKLCQAFVLKPAGHDGPLPTVFWVHGGPIHAWSDAWQWRWNPLTAVERGYMVVLPNPRGSTGFGQQWVEGIWGNVWGGQCFEDVMAVVDHVSGPGDSDGARLALMGGSFGGYMTNWVGTQTGERFRCLITHAGVTSFNSFHGTTDLPAYWQLMERYSPIRYIERWRAPTLVIHGARDYRVDVGEALLLFEALQSNGVKSELLVFPDENHWILRPKNIIAWYEGVYEFLGRHLA
jgi:dipeptidyl aminopeptidase/acylaminoacyl peptidase